MLVNPGSSRLSASTITIDDPGNLLDFITPSDAAFFRGKEGFVAIGEILRLEGDSADEIDCWWKEFAPQIENETEMPGEFGVGPLVLATFPFTETSARRSLAYIPQKIIGRRDGVCWLTEIGKDRVEPKLPERNSLAPDSAAVLFEKRSAEDWMERVEGVLAELESSQLSKVLIARDLIGESDTAIDPRRILSRLIQNQPRGWAYLIDGLVGISPALAIRRRYGLTTSRIVAGSLPRSSGQDDLRQTATLISSHSHRASHRHAVEVARDALKDFYTHVHVPDAPYVMLEPTMMALTTDLTGIVSPEYSTLAMMNSLHPASILEDGSTCPLTEILERYESMDRERYHGPVGWMDVQGDGSWTEAMNCAQLSEDRHGIRLFTGSGVVKGTTPHHEYVKTVSKLIPLKNALAD